MTTQNPQNEPKTSPILRTEPRYYVGLDLGVVVADGSRIDRSRSQIAKIIRNEPKPSTTR
jgi:hypothetical protein